jgi:uncharacterized protein
MMSPVATPSRDFQVFAKPAGAACNLACGYCYYRRTLAPGAAVPRMAPDVLETYVAQHVAAAPDGPIQFSWHGGEPTLLGLDYFQAIVAVQRRHRPAGRRIANGIQTNGVLVDDAWCRFFAEEGFTVGLSLDGPAPQHDAWRVTRGGRGTHAEAMRALERLQRHGVGVDILCAVHRVNVQHPLRVYRFLRASGARSLGFLPVVEPVPGSLTGVSSHTVPADAYGAFLCAVFDEWVAHDATRVAVQNFDEALRPARGLDHSLCVFRETCGQVPVLEHDGTVYACDHFVDAAHRIGSIRERSLADLLDDPRLRAFGQAKRDALPTQCRSCDVIASCNGGCPKDRSIDTSGEGGLNYLCGAFKRFFGHCQPWAAAIARQPRSAAPPGPARDARLGVDTRPPPDRPGRAVPAVGRNDPCPCGSGRKYKQCCLAAS